MNRRSHTKLTESCFICGDLRGGCVSKLVFAIGSKMEQAPIKIVPVDNDDHAAGGDASSSVHYMYPVCVVHAASIATV